MHNKKESVFVNRDIFRKDYQGLNIDVERTLMEFLYRVLYFLTLFHTMGNIHKVQLESKMD